MATYRYTARFNLERGMDYKKWKIYDRETEEVLFVDPESNTIRFFDCHLVNNVRTATDIFNGANKRVCALIEAKAISIYPSKTQNHVKVHKLIQIKFNPRTSIHWNSVKSENLDNQKFASLITNNCQVFDFSA